MGVLRKITHKSGKVSWQIDYIDPDGKRVRLNYDKKKEAAAELAKRSTLIDERHYREVKSQKNNKTTFGDLVDEYKKDQEAKSKTKFEKAKKYFVDHAEKFFGRDRLLVSFDYEALTRYKSWLETTTTQHGKLRKISTVNREMSCLRDMFKCALRWDRPEKRGEDKMLAETPFSKGESLHNRKEKNSRKLFLSEDQVKRLVECSPPHLAHVIICAVNTGLDVGDILSLKWVQIRDGFIYLNRAKTGNEVEIPVSDTLQALFDKIKDSQEEPSNVVDMKGRTIKRKPIKSEYVFLYRGEKIKSIKTAFKRACEKAGIAYGREVPGGITFKDLRHTFASHFVMRGGSLAELQELLAHETPTMTKRYAHLIQAHKKETINRMNSLTGSSDQVILSHFRAVWKDLHEVTGR